MADKALPDRFYLGMSWEPKDEVAGYFAMLFAILTILALISGNALYFTVFGVGTVFSYYLFRKWRKEIFEFLEEKAKKSANK